MRYAEELRTAAAKERFEWGSERATRMWPRPTAIHLALAEWLDDTAESLDANAGSVEGIPSILCALNVARAITGGAA